MGGRFESRKKLEGMNLRRTEGGGGRWGWLEVVVDGQRQPKGKGGSEIKKFQGGGCGGSRAVGRQTQSRGWELLEGVDITMV